MKNLNRLFLVGSILAMLVLTVVFVPAAHAQTNVGVHRGIPYDSYCAPAVVYDWHFTGKVIPKGTNQTTAEATQHAQFKYNGACGTPQVVGLWCNEAPRQLVGTSASSCYWYDTYDTNKTVWTIGTNPVYWNSVEICQLDVLLGSDMEGDYLTSLGGTNC